MRAFKSIVVLTLSFVILIAVSAHAQKEIIMASTTSTDNSGLFAHLLPMFEKKTGIKVKVVARGTGASIEMGRRGDADVVFVHAKDLELKALEEGLFVNRHDVMYNDFIIVAPPKDPAQVKGTKSAVEAFRKIAASGQPFVSRGDKSGTHARELEIWKRADIDPKGQKWYLEVGQGMEKTQRIASEKQGYALTDRGTWLATKDKDKIELVMVFEGDPILFNQYGVMAVNPEKHKHVKYKEATEFVNWIISKEGQEAIASFKDKLGNQLFYPNAK